MNKACFKRTVWYGLMLTSFHSVYASSQPLFDLVPLTPTILQLPVNETAIISYSVTNRTKLTRTLTWVPIAGVSQDSNGFGSCASPFTLQPNQSCLLNLVVNGENVPCDGIISSPVVCKTKGFGDNSPNPLLCSRTSQDGSLRITSGSYASKTTTLKLSTTSLVLAADGILTDSSGTGGNFTSKARVIVITNSGTNPALDVAYNVSLPPGTTIMPASCGTIAPNDSCILTVTPGQNPSSVPPSAPNPSILTIQGSNTPAVISYITVLTYGNIFQDGYVFAIDDSTPPSKSVGGTVMALTNQANAFPNGIIWSSDNTGVVAYDPIPGIYQNSFASLTSCQGKSDGNCNTNVIIDYYNHKSDTPVPLNYYAAGLCRTYISGNKYNDWYLPAICQLGYFDSPDIIAPDPGCGSPSNPLQQNIAANLFYNNNIANIIIGSFYWSSTEAYNQDASSNNISAWYIKFGTPDSSPNQEPGTFQSIKGNKVGVYCVRSIT